MQDCFGIVTQWGIFAVCGMAVIIMAIDTLVEFTQKTNTRAR